MRFFHGTSIDRQVGDVLSPPSVTGVESLYGRSDAGRVYASTRFDVAAEYADYTAMMRDGSPVVYEVVPVDASIGVEADPHDENDGTYFRSTGWRIVGVHYL